MTGVITKRFRFLFGDDRSIYAITAAGELLWYPVWTDTSDPPSVGLGRQIGGGWAAFSHVFAGGATPSTRTGRSVPRRAAGWDQRPRRLDRLGQRLWQPDR